MSPPVLDIQDLSVNYQTDQGPLQALRDVNLRVPARQDHRHCRRERLR